MQIAGVARAEDVSWTYSPALWGAGHPQRPTEEKTAYSGEKSQGRGGGTIMAEGVSGRPFIYITFSCTRKLRNPSLIPRSDRSHGRCVESSNHFLTRQAGLRTGPYTRIG